MKHETRNLTEDHVVLMLSEYLAEVKSQMVTPRKIKRSLKEEQQKIKSDCIPTLVKLTEVERSKKESISIKVKEMKRQIDTLKESLPNLQIGKKKLLLIWKKKKPLQQML